jgi:hypothetical protein
LQARFREHVNDNPKVVARNLAKVGAEISPHTVAAHQKQLPQNWDAFIAYCRAYPGFALDALELMGIDIDQDRAAYATFLSMKRQITGEQS